jgi:hypothetical protein
MKKLIDITNRLTAHYEAKLAEHGDSEQGMDWGVGTEFKRFKVLCNVEVVGVGGDSTSPPQWLDYGCGTGRLLAHNDIRPFDYTGADNCNESIKQALIKRPDATWVCGNIIEHPSLFKEYDYTIVNGVFTQKLDIGYTDFYAFMSETLKRLWAITKCGIAVNFTSNVVDWRKDNLFHLPMDDFMEFCWKELGTRNVVFRNDYGLYEYTAYVYK